MGDDRADRCVYGRRRGGILCDVLVGGEDVEGFSEVERWVVIRALNGGDGLLVGGEDGSGTVSEGMAAAGATGSRGVCTGAASAGTKREILVENNHSRRRSLWLFMVVLMLPLRRPSSSRRRVFIPLFGAEPLVVSFHTRCQSTPSRTTFPNGRRALEYSMNM